MLASSFSKGKGDNMSRTPSDDNGNNKEIKKEIEQVIATLPEAVHRIETDMTITVGSNGDYSTLGEAIRYLSKNRPSFVNNGLNVTVKLLSGFVMAEQVFMKGLDLRWITITSKDPIVSVRRETLTEPYSLRGGYLDYPIFGATNCNLPVFSEVIFNMDNTGDKKKRTSGLAIRENSFVSFGYDCGFTNCIGGYGLYVAYNSYADVKNIDVSGAGLAGISVRHKSEVNARDKDDNSPPRANNCGVGISAEWMSKVFFRRGEANNCMSDAVYTSQSEINCDSISAQSSKGYGIRATEGSIINAFHSANFSNASLDGVYIEGGSLVNAPNCIAVNCGRNGLSLSSGRANVTNANFSGALSTGINASKGCFVDAQEADVSKCGSYGVRSSNGSNINFTNGNAIRNIDGTTTDKQDMRIANGSFISAVGAKGGTLQTVNTLTIDGVIFK